MISRRKEIFFVALCVVFSALFTIGCSDSLLHPAQDGTRILVQLENSSSRSGDTPPPTEKWQGSAWIESRDGSESHHQKISSETDELSITFENIVIGSEIRIHLDVTSSSETAKRYKGSSNWKKIIDGVNVIVIVLKEVEVQEGDEPGQENPPSQETPTDADVPAIQEMSSVETSDSQERLEVTASVADGGDLTYQWYSNTSLSNKGGTKIEGATEADYTATVPAGETRYFYCVVKNTNEAATGNKIATATSNVVAVTNNSTSGTTTPEGELSSITATYNGSPILVGDSPSYRDFTVTENYSDGNSVVISSIDGLYTVDVPKNSIGYVPVTIKSTKDDSIQTLVPVQIQYKLDVDNLTLNGSTSVEQNGTLELVANYPDTTYQIHEGDDSTTTYIVKDNLNISWQGTTKQPNSWEAMAETSNAGTGKKAIVTLTPKDEWCVTTGGITASHTYTVTAITQTYNIGDEYRDDSGALIGYVFEVSDSYIKIVETNHSWNYTWCGFSSNITDWGAVSTITDGQAMYNKMAENTKVIDNTRTIFYYAKTQKNETDSGWYIPTKEELFDIFKMDETHVVLNISGAYWSSTIASASNTEGYKAYYVQGSGASPNDSSPDSVDKENNVIAVKKITLN